MYVDMRGRRLAVLLALAAALLPIGASSGAQASGDAPTLLVRVADDPDWPGLELVFDFGSAGNPASVSLFPPASFELYPVRPRGRVIGRAVVYAGDFSYGSSATTLLSGPIVADSMDAVSEAKAAACSPGQHIAVWRVQLSLLGQPFELPIYIASAGRDQGDPTPRFRLDLCAPPLPGGDAALPIVGLAFSLEDLEAPRTAGLHVWQAVVTPLAPDQRSSLPDRIYELRATVPVPHRITLVGRYAAKDRRAVLTGRLSATGRPRPGARVYFVALVRRVTPNGVVFNDRLAGSTLTGANGAYQFRTRISQTTGFVAIVPEAVVACPGSQMPRGCPSATVSGVQSEPITVSVPKPGRR